MAIRAAGAWTAAAALALAATLALHYGAPDPSADTSRGSEDAFARGLHRRELPPRQGPLRWTGERARFQFRLLPDGPALLEVEVRGHRGPVAVAADGVVVGVLSPGVAEGRFALPDTGRRSREVELRVPAFRARDGRWLGAQLRRVTLRPLARRAPPPGLVLAFVLPCLAGLAGAAAAGLGWPAALALAGGLALTQLLALWPAGAVRSSYTFVLAGILTAGCGLVLGYSRWANRRWPGSAPAAYATLVFALLVQGVAATSPLMVVSDAVFHANNLARVSAGDLWLTSVTQHAPPFRFPYGVSFYVLLAPLHRLGLDAVWLVRAGAALSALAASAALFALLARRGAARAGLAVAILQALPVTFDLFSYGNLSNVFGQALSALFFCWWAAGGPGGWLVGAALVVVGALGHFSSLIVLVFLSLALLVARRGDLRRERWRVVGVAGGLGLSLGYYAAFAPLVASQLPRLLEGGASAPPGAAAPLLRPLLAALAQWGAPVIILALAGLPRPRRDGLDRDLAAYWAAGGALAVVAVGTPLDVRYLYALGLPLAVAAAEGALRLWSWGSVGRLAAAGLAAGQAFLAGRNLAEAVLWRYRP